MTAYEEALEAGCMPYSDPERLTADDVDPLLWPAVERINGSGWIWTGESCQGHPDADYPGAWAGNTDPYLSLFFRTENEGRFFGCLGAAATSFGDLGENEDDWLFYTPLFRLHVSHRKEGWTEVEVYVQASTAWDRDMGIRLWERFAGEVGRADKGECENTDIGLAT